MFPPVMFNFSRTLNGVGAYLRRCVQRPCCCLRFTLPPSLSSQQYKMKKSNEEKTKSIADAEARISDLTTKIEELTAVVYKDNHETFRCSGNCLHF